MDKLFDTKRTYIGYDGEEYIDMCIPVVSVKDMTGSGVEEVNQDCKGRIDNFTWKKVGKNLDMIDMVMYANHIFNPFAVKDGDLLNIPNSDDSLYRSSEEPPLPDGTRHANKGKGEKTSTYAEKIEYMARKGLGLK